MAIVVAVVLLVLVLMPERIEEGRCKLVRKKADPESQLMGLAFQLIRPLEARPDRVQDVPTGFGEPRYYEIKSGKKPVLMAADFSQKLVRLCIDTDGDGVLSEERCLTAKVSEETPVSSRRQQFGPISLVSGDSAAKTDGAFYVNCFREDARALLIPYPASFRTGKLLLAGQAYRVAVVDGDHDGLFNSLLSLPLDRPWRMPGCDFFAIEPGQTTSIRVGPPFVIRADVEKSGPRAVSIAPAIVGCGGEEYDIGFRHNHKRAPEPAFRIVDEEGTVLVDDRFQYG